MFRTTCLGCRPDWTRTWTSVTSPMGLTTTRADRIPDRLVRSFSARRTPHGSDPPDVLGTLGSSGSGLGTRWGSNAATIRSLHRLFVCRQFCRYHHVSTLRLGLVQGPIGR